MNTQHLFGILVFTGASAIAGCTANAKVSGTDANSPSDVSSTTTPTTTSASSNNGEAVGHTSQADTAAPSSSTSSSTAPASKSTSTPQATTPSTPAPSKADGKKDLPGVGNQRKADGTQPGKVGQGLNKDDKKDEKK